MVFIWIGLAAAASGTAGWYTGHLQAKVATIASVALVAAAVVGILVLRGPGQQVVAAAMVGFVAGNAVVSWRALRTGKATARRSAS